MDYKELLIAYIKYCESAGQANKFFTKAQAEEMDRLVSTINPDFIPVAPKYDNWLEEEANDNHRTIHP